MGLKSRQNAGYSNFLGQIGNLFSRQWLANWMKKKFRGKMPEVYALSFVRELRVRIEICGGMRALYYA